MRIVVLALKVLLEKSEHAQIDSFWEAENIP
jgi:hypothetical protein